MEENRKNEARIQAEIVARLRAMGHEAIHIPNEQADKGNGMAKAIRIGQLVAMGMYPGAADLLVPLGANRTVFLEVKTDRGRQSESQQRFENHWCHRYGYPYKVVRSADEAEAFVNMVKGSM